jgi:preprotein translocase subunit SecG
MMIFPVLAVGFIMKLVMVLFMLCSVALILVVLIQKGKGGGLSGVLGGGMASGLLGSKTGDFLTWVTIGMVGMFLLLAVIMAKFYKPSVSDYGPAPAQQQQPANQRQPQGTEQPKPVDSGGQTNADANKAGG